MFHNVDSKEYSKDAANCSSFLLACDWLSWSNNRVSTRPPNEMVIKLF